MSQADLFGSSAGQRPNPYDLKPNERWAAWESTAWGLLDALTPESVDLVLVDPAYPSLEKHRAKGTTTRLSQSKASSSEWFEVMSYNDMRDMLAAAFRALKPERHAYILCDDETAAWMRREAWAVGFYIWPSITWIKTRDEGERVRIGMGYHYRQASERIVFLEKRSGRRPPNVGDGIEAVPSPWGKGRKLADLSIPNVLPGILDPEIYPDALAYDMLRGPDAYPTEKPVALLDTLIRQSTQPDEIVVDPCCGSGSTGHAAFAAGRRVILGDVKRSAVDRAGARLSRLIASGCRGVVS